MSTPRGLDPVGSAAGLQAEQLGAVDHHRLPGEAQLGAPSMLSAARAASPHAAPSHAPPKHWPGCFFTAAGGLEGGEPARQHGEQSQPHCDDASLSFKRLASYLSLVSVNRTWRRTIGSYLLNSSFTGNFFGFFLCGAQE